jgi:hypothetical protein
MDCKVVIAGGNFARLYQLQLNCAEACCRSTARHWGRTDAGLRHAAGSPRATGTGQPAQMRPPRCLRDRTVGYALPTLLHVRLSHRVSAC